MTHAHDESETALSGTHQESPTTTDFIAEAITEAFGERCPDYAEGCAACDAWKQYDDLRALSAIHSQGAAPSEEPVGYLFELCYSHDHNRWSGTMYSSHIPDPKDVRNVRPLFFASPAVAPVAVSVKAGEPVAWLILGTDRDDNETWVAVTKNPAGVYGPNMPIHPLYLAPPPAPDQELQDKIETALSSIIPATKGGEDELRRAWEYGRNSWCPAGILTDKERTESEWRKALAALSAQDTDGVAKP
ncbi:MULTISPECIES: hypothetical protein [Mesorhizobium]|uniref:hypothetical protein n=1 Tax=Mesorhizobium TaxID=68287 RepID=UPI0007A93B07|nr:MULTISPECIES: hypothetical protein [Mesorhizobium]AMX93661.1 hypothetical protein A4R28_11405 [Mesorhizobium ciceri]MDF3208353.1 hypothetical protein [Mesorhizobium sp. LMG15046]MDF3229075.1 hypothetical protein [Mesorhizobium sp. DSM 30133]RUU22187.1 hypothetical protein EOC84_03485 [Mesorhizobium sp. Primo-B]RUU37903.1 hypothetical protein EOC83_16730 [Mesorhizobium sp. Primo-A]